MHKDPKWNQVYSSVINNYLACWAESRLIWIIPLLGVEEWSLFKAFILIEKGLEIKAESGWYNCIVPDFSAFS